MRTGMRTERSVRQLFAANCEQVVRHLFASQAVSRQRVAGQSEQANASARKPPHTPQGARGPERPRALGWEACVRVFVRLAGNGSSGAERLPDGRRNRRALDHSLFRRSGFRRPGRALAAWSGKEAVRPGSRHVGRPCAPRGQSLGQNSEVTL